jgi:DNA-binding transcriptional LysR family regulator
MRGPEFAELTAFMAVVQARSFRGAARRLGVTASSLSRTINRLEARLGMRLLNRTTRSVSSTEAGVSLHARLAPVLASLDDAVKETAALQDSPAGTLRLNLPKLAADLVLMPLLARFRQAHPLIRLDLMIDDGLSDIVADGYDAGIRIGRRLAKDMVALRLTDDYRIAVAGSPEYFAEHPMPSAPEDLRTHACLNYRWAGSGALYRWHFDGPDGPLDVDVDGPLVVNDTHILREAAKDGMGLVCLPEAFLASDIENGALIRVMDAWCKPFPGFYLYHPSRQRTPAALRAMIDFLQAQRGGPRP